MLRFFKKFKHLTKFAALSILTVLAVTTSVAAFSLTGLHSRNLPPQNQPFANTEIGQVINLETGQATIRGTSKHPELSGQILLIETPNGLSVSGSFFNSPPGDHGFHVHEFGSCEEDGNAAGGHYNPLLSLSEATIEQLQSNNL